MAESNDTQERGRALGHPGASGESPTRRTKSGWMGRPWVAVVVAIYLVEYSLGQDDAGTDGCSPRGVTGALNAGDCAALLTAHAAWGGRPAEWTAGIEAGSSYCSWHGIACSRRRVFRLELHNQSLTGPIPEQLGSLTQLRVLDLYNNSLTGNLPKSLTDLRRLVFLVIGSNMISGTISAKFARLRQLKYLLLNHNQLGGTIPTSLGSLSDLTAMNVANNRFSAWGEGICAWGHLEKIAQFHCSGNNFTTVPSCLPDTCGLATDFPGMRDTCSAAGVTGDVNAGDCAALIAAYVAWGNKPAQWTGSIAAGSPFCLWSGVVCNEKRVATLFLADSDLEGTLPRVLGDLGHLRTLLLSNNKLGGTVPSSIGSLTLLRTLNLANNSFTAFDPSICSWHHVDKISNFECSGNNFTEVPSCLPMMCRMSAGSDAAADECSASGVSGSLDAGDCAAILGIFQAWRGRPLLWAPSIAANASYCHYPGIVCEGSRVATIFLNNAQISGTIPPQLGSLERLTDLYLADNRLYGEIPQELAKLSGLRILILSHNELGGAIPEALGKLTQLTALNLANNRFTSWESGICSWGHVRYISRLTCFGNNFTSVPACLPDTCGLPRPTADGCRASGVTGSRLNEGDCTALLVAYAAWGGRPTEWTAAITAGSSYCEWPGVHCTDGRVSRLFLEHTDLTGEVPRELGDLTELVDLFVAHNALHGTIPPEIGRLSRLAYLHLEHNKLSGSLPPALGRLTDLLELYTGHNELSGTLPPELGSLSNLIYLSVENNKLRGSVPESLWTLRNLKALLLTGNKLTGTEVPANFTHIAHL